MVRPRWHDALIVAAIAGVLVLGVWALWWDDVRSFVKGDTAGDDKEESVKAPVPTGQT